MIFRKGKVLVALDTSERAPIVLAAAADVARRFNVKLSLLRVVGVPTELPREAFSLPPQGLEKLLVKDAEESLGRIAATLADTMVESVRVREGTPWRTICDEAAESSADLIVIGSHGYGGIDRVLGTTAGRVVNHAPCSVLVVNMRS